MSPPAAANFVTSSYSRILARELGLHERELPRLLQGTGLPREVLLPGDETRISASQQLRILQNAFLIDSSPELGLRLGRRLQPATHGPIGHLVLSSPDLLTALEALRDYLPLRIGIAELRLQRVSTWLDCRLLVRIAVPAAEHRMLLECFALLLQSLVESVLDEVPPEAVFEFEFAPPGHLASYPAYFRSPTLFGCEHTRVRLPESALHSANAAGDATAYRMARDQCERLLQRVPASSLSMTNRVKRLLLSMPAGTACEEGVARALFISRRTLARRLEAEGSGYRQLREQVLAARAAGHLREDGLTVEAVAEVLGYHDSANFRRAFRRWYGCSPQAFKRHSEAAR